MIKIFKKIQKILFIVTLVITLVLFLSCFSSKAKASSLPSVYFGAAGGAGGSGDFEYDQVQFQKDAGKNTAIFHQYFTIKQETCKDSNFAFPQHDVYFQNKYYGFILGFDMLRMDPPFMEPLPGVRGLGKIPMLSVGTDKNSDVLSGNLDSCFTKFARGAAAWGKPFFLRLDWEMNLDGFAWGMEHKENKIDVGNTPEKFKSMWRHIHDIFTANNAKNVTWVWCPNVGSTDNDSRANTSTLSRLYPGDGYVDWTCVDGYGGGSVSGQSSDSTQDFRSFYEIIKSTYDKIVSLYPSKPMMIGEWSTKELSDSNYKANWYKNFLNVSTMQAFPRLKAVVSFNVDSYRIETSSQSQAAFKAGIADSYFAGESNVYKTIECTNDPKTNMWCPITPQTIAGAIWNDPLNTCSAKDSVNAWKTPPDLTVNLSLGATNTSKQVVYGGVGNYTTYSFDVLPGQDTYKVNLSSIPAGYALSTGPNCSGNTNDRVVTIPSTTAPYAYHTDFFITKVGVAPTPTATPVPVSINLNATLSTTNNSGIKSISRKLTVRSGQQINFKLTVNGGSNKLKQAFILVEKIENNKSVSPATIWGCIPQSLLSGTTHQAGVDQWCVIGGSSATSGWINNYTYSANSTWTIPINIPANYYVAVVVYSLGASKCSSDPVLTSYPVAGYDYCGNESYMEVDVQ